MSEEEIKQAFENNSDCYADTWKDSEAELINGKSLMEEGPVIPAMTKEKFVMVVKELFAKSLPVKPDGIDLNTLAFNFTRNWTMVTGHPLEARRISEAFKEGYKQALSPLPPAPVEDEEEEDIYDAVRSYRLDHPEIMQDLPVQSEVPTKEEVNLWLKKEYPALHTNRNLMNDMFAVTAEILRDFIRSWQAQKENLKDVEGETKLK